MRGLFCKFFTTPCAELSRELSYFVLIRPLVEWEDTSKHEFEIWEKLPPLVGKSDSDVLCGALVEVVVDVG